MQKILLKLLKYVAFFGIAFVVFVLIAGSMNDAQSNPAFLIIPFTL